VDPVWVRVRVVVEVDDEVDVDVSVRVPDDVRCPTKKTIG
jgi:hypothetical protein